MFEYHLTYVVGHIFLKVVRFISIICIPLLSILVFTLAFDKLLDYLSEKTNTDLKDSHLSLALIVMQVLGLFFGLLLLKVLGIVNG